MSLDFKVNKDNVWRLVVFLLVACHPSCHPCTGILFLLATINT